MRGVPGRGDPGRAPDPGAGPSGWAGLAAGSNPWLLRFDGYDPAAEGLREALCTLGNGYWGTRGAAPEADADAVHYPGCYLAGVYNRVSSEIEGRVVEAEHMVNGPNWLPLWFRVADGGWFHPASAKPASAGADPVAPAAGPAHSAAGPPPYEVLTYGHELDLRRGVLTRNILVRDPAGRTTRLRSERFVSQNAPHIAVLASTFEAEDWSGPLTVRSGLEGRVRNGNVAAEQSLATTHLTPRKSFEVDAESVLLEMETTHSGIHIAVAARTRVFGDGKRLHPERRFLRDGAGWVAQEFDLALTRGQPVRVEKTVAVHTSRDRAIASPALAAALALQRVDDAARLLADHERDWQILWDEFAVDVHSDGRQALALNLNTFHVLQTLAAVDVDLDAGVPARGLHGEGYRGHIFWDELFVYPILTLRRPDLSRALLGYRYRRLGEARAAARAAGHEGAMFPWQSGIDGREATPRELFNPRSGSWMPDHSSRQRHVGLALAFSVWRYYQSTGDVEFLIEQGAEIILEVARFFASLSRYDAAAGRYDIAGVMGPDEFHDGYPHAPGEGVRNNTYTNVMTAWVMRRAAETVELLAGHYCEPLWNRLRLRPGEIHRWRHISLRLRIAFHSDGVPSQFEGYEQLPEFDWAGYRAKYGDLSRLDLILAAEGDNSNNYRLAKQGDVLMLLYLFSAEELRELLESMGYSLSPDAVVRTVEFYAARSTHGSTLSNVVHSWVEARRDRERSWSYLARALESDLADIQGGTTREGIHLGAMAGSIDMLTRCYTGLEIRDDVLLLHPVLPAHVGRLGFSIHYRQQPVRIDVDTARVRLTLRAGRAQPIRVRVEGRGATLAPGDTRDFPLGG